MHYIFAVFSLLLILSSSSKKQAKRKNSKRSNKNGKTSSRSKRNALTDEDKLYADKAMKNFKTPIRKFYLYEWPKSVTESWPEKYAVHRLERLSIAENFGLNNGTGPILSRSAGLHHTHQYSLFRTFMARLNESPLRTHRAEEASLFFIPYDIGMDATTRSSDGAMVFTHCPRVKSVLDLLTRSQWFQRKGGSDHAFLHTVNQPFQMTLDKKCQPLYGLCRNCTKLSIDAYKPSFFKSLLEHDDYTHRWMSIPFPSNIHRSDDMTAPYSWQVSNTSDPRRYPIVFAGSLMVTATKARTLRAAIIQECRARPTECMLIELRSHSSNTDNRNSSSKRSPYNDGTFCLMPGGDYPTRKGVLDALLVGCIPVTFQRATAHRQWPWHWGTQSTADSCMHYVPMRQVVADPRAFFQELVKLSRDESFVAAKRACIARVGARMQYDLPGHSHAVRSRSTDAGEMDAVDVVLKNLLYEQSSKKFRLRRGKSLRESH